VIEAGGETIRFRIQAEVPAAETSPEEGFAWSILRALAHEVTSETGPGGRVIGVVRSRGPVLDSAL
jgi:hypothetical protein